MAELNELFNKYINNQCSPEEIEALMNTRHAIMDQLQEMILQDLERKDDEKDNGEFEGLLDSVYLNIQHHIRKEKKGSIRPWPRIAAACALLLLSAGIHFTLMKRQSRTQQIAQTTQSNITPGGNKAILTLANGKQIILTGAQNGNLAFQGNTVINKIANGQIVYNADSSKNKDSNGLIAYNTMTVPRGGQYHLVLADGTNVWLNAASSIRYPIAFTGNERQVELTGEAYFEVTHNRLKPFSVISNGQTVEVLGTHFNINAYTDEGAIKTDLLEGSVKVSKDGKTVMLKPGQESMNLHNSAISVKESDVQMAVAWKNGFFSFKRADLKTVMRQIARWYDVEVSYEGTIPTTAITGEAYRNVNAAEALEILSNLGIKFKIEGRKITILQK